MGKKVNKKKDKYSSKKSGATKFVAILLIIAMLVSVAIYILTMFAS